MSSEQSNADAPSMLGAHVKYAQGAVSSALGYETGEQTKTEAVSEMREAKKQNDEAPTQSNVLGTVEQKVGDLTGCEGMQNEGKSRQTTTGEMGGQTG